MERCLPVEGVAIELPAGQELLGDQALDVAAQIEVAEIGGRRGPCQPDDGRAARLHAFTDAPQAVPHVVVAGDAPGADKIAERRQRRGPSDL